MRKNSLHDLYRGRMTNENAASADFLSVDTGACARSDSARTLHRRRCNAELAHLVSHGLASLADAYIADRPNSQKSQELNRDVPKAISPSS